MTIGFPWAERDDEALAADAERARRFLAASAQRAEQQGAQLSALHDGVAAEAHETRTLELARAMERHCDPEAVAQKMNEVLAAAARAHTLSEFSTAELRAELDRREALD